jgi:hypothetical protein
MSMGVDLSSPLTREEREYLAARGRYADIERVDALHGVTDGQELDAGDGTGPQYVPLMTGEQRAGEAARLRARLAELEAADEDAADEDTDEVAPYEEWKKPELDAELERRSLLKTGTNAEKAQRLRDDDATAEV